MRPFLWTLAVLALVAALAASGCTSFPPAKITPTATPCVACMVNSPPNPPANLTVDEQRLVAFVNEAAAYARANGRDAAIAQFNSRNGSFVRDDLYVFAYDMNGTVFALPFQPEVVGTNRSEATDVRGTKYVRDGVAAARNGSGFHELWYPNPADNYAVEPKTCYVVGMGDWFIGSGYYMARTNASVNASALSTKEGLATFVEQAAAYARARGREAALADFNNRTGPFASGDVYVYALDYNGTVLALPFQPEKVGTGYFNDARDSNGQYYTRAEIRPRAKGRRFRLLRLPEPGARHGDRAEDELRAGRGRDLLDRAGRAIPVVTATPVH